MAKNKVNILSGTGNLIGYFVDPQIQCFPQGEYEISGHFFDANGELATKVDFNPQARPYLADLASVDKMKHTRLKNVYVQRGRQPIRMTGCGENSGTSS